MVDYKEAFAYAEFWRTEIAPKLRHVVDRSITFTDYLQGFYKNTSAIKTFGIPIPYIYTLEFLEKHQDKCVTFLYNSPDEVAKGASILSAIYQFSPQLHGLANIHIWRDENESDGHVTVFLIYENFVDVTEFSEQGISLVKKPKVVQKGFGFSE